MAMTKKQRLRRKAEIERASYKKHYHSRRAARKERDILFLAKKDLYKRSLECANPDCRVTGFEDPKIIEFHHLDPALKSFSPHKATSWIAFLMEVGKCIPLCKDCHVYLETWKKETKRRKYLAELEISDPVPF